MIVKQVAAGAKTAGLLAYLYGPGVGEARGGTVHVAPRTIGSWDGQPQLHQAVRTDRGRLSIGSIARTLDTPVALAERVPAKHVGHIVVANHPDDPVLSDRQWQRIAADVMKRAGLARGVGDPDAVRWIAVRHDDTSIHIAYTRVRESGRGQGYVNYTKAWQQLRHDWEKRLGLTPTGLADGGSRKPYDKAEFARAKAQRFAGNTTARPDSARLRRECRLAAMTSRSPEQFERRLTERGVRVEHDANGYRVGLGNGPLREAKLLDPAITAESLAERWRGVPGGIPPAGDAAVRDAVRERLAGATAVGHDQLVDVIHAAGELTGNMTFADAAEALSVRAPRQRAMQTSSARELHHRAVVLDCLARATSKNDAGRDVERLALALAGLLAEVGRDGRHDRRLEQSYRQARAHLVVLTHAADGNGRGLGYAASGPLGAPSRGSVEPFGSVEDVERVGESRAR